MIEVDLMNIEIGKDVNQLTSMIKSNRKEADPATAQQATIDAAKLNQAPTEVSEVKAEEKPEALEISTEHLQGVAQQLQDFVSSLDKSLQFSIHKDSGRDVIKVIDGVTGETIRQIPSEEILNVVSNLSQATGIFMETKV